MPTRPNDEPTPPREGRGLPGADAVSFLLHPERQVRAVADQFEAIRVLTEAGVFRPTRPSRLVGALIELARWGFTPPAAYATAAARFPDEAAIIDDAGTVTFSDVERRTDAIAAGLRAAGVEEGDRVGLLCRNHRYFVESIVALSKLGADVLLLNTSFAGPQLADVVRRERGRAIIHDAEFSDVLKQAVRGRKHYLAWNEAESRVPTLDDLAAAHQGESVGRPSRVGRFVILTSGTTGTPKGASRSGESGLGPVIAILSRIPLHVRETTVIAAPLFHAWGFANLLIASLLSSTVVLQRKFDPEATLTGTAQHRASTLVAVPVMLQRMLDLPEPVRRARRPRDLRIVAVSGSALGAGLAREFMDEFGDVVYNLYGSTEVAWASIANPEELRSAPGTVGRPPRGTVIRLLDDAGNEVAPGGIGRIFVGSEMVFEGYTSGGDKERLGGLVSTGDVGRFDESGLLFVEGRDDDMIVSGGENVFPAEVEELLSGHEAVAEVAVVGVDDPDFGQRLAAYVVRRPGATVEADALRAYVRSHLARYKVPRDVVFLEQLPRNATGKVIKRALAAEAPATTTSPAR